MSLLQKGIKIHELRRANKLICMLWHWRQGGGTSRHRITAQINLYSQQLAADCCVEELKVREPITGQLIRIESLREEAVWSLRGSNTDKPKDNGFYCISVAFPC